MITLSILQQRSGRVLTAATASLALLCAITGAAADSVRTAAAKFPPLAALSSRVDTSLKLESRMLAGDKAPQWSWVTSRRDRLRMPRGTVRPACGC